MLIEFSIENFRSIKDEVTLSLLASSDKSLQNNLIKTDVLKKEKLLRSVVIYGANASGKSNVLSAFDFLSELILQSHRNQKGDKILFTPFKLEKKYLSKPTKFRIVFIKDEINYVYGVSFTHEKIIDEYLYYYPKNHKAIIFERKNTNDYKFTIDKTNQNFLSEKTPENVLYLSRSSNLEYEKTNEAFEWFKDGLRTITTPFDNLSIMPYTADLLKEENSKSVILKSLYDADMGIDDIGITMIKISDELPIDIPEKLKGILGKIKDIIIEEEPNAESIKIHTLHKNVRFDFSEESEGTQRYFSLIGPLINAIGNGGTLIVDELDIKLHHNLTESLIKVFNNPEVNKKNAQLIFATHNTNLLDQKLFRRDQIWFTEKNPDDGSTDLYSLIEYKPRKDKDITKGYLAGRYGGLPLIKGNLIY